MKAWKALWLSLVVSGTVVSTSMATLHNFAGASAPYPSCPSGSTGYPDYSLTSISPNDNAAWITYLYQEILGRSPEPSGLSGWTGAANAGTPRLQIVDAFLQSSEYANHTVIRLYQTLLQRAPDPSASGWIDLIKSGHDWLDVANAICDSPEYKSKQPRTAHVTMAVYNQSAQSADYSGFFYATSSTGTIAGHAIFGLLPPGASANGSFYIRAGTQYTQSEHVQFLTSGDPNPGPYATADCTQTFIPTADQSNLSTVMIITGNAASGYSCSITIN